MGRTWGFDRITYSQDGVYLMKEGNDVENFQEIDQINDDVKDGPALVDFYGNNCSSCRMLIPLVERFASEYQGRVRFYKLNIDDHMDLAEQY